MTTWERLADLPLVVDGYTLSEQARRISPEFERVTHTIALRGDGEAGLGEDVTYDADEQRAHAADGPVLAARPARSRSTSFSRAARRVRPLRRPRALARRLPRLPPLGVRVGGARPRAAPGRPLARRRARARAAPRPLRRLAAARHPARRRRDRPPPRALPRPRVQARRRPELGRRPARHARGHRRRRGDRPQGRLPRHPGRRRHRPGALRARRRGAAGRVARGPRPHGPRGRRGAAPVPRPDHLGRADPLGRRTSSTLPFAPRTLNVKPSRFGSLERLFDFYDHCEANGIGLYGGGQSELGVGRGQIQVLAALLHPDGSNDIAPAGYDWLEFPPGLDPSPLDPALEPTGFRRRGPAPD